jgi:hypothetical protein
MKIPSVIVATGSNFGCRSIIHPSVLQECQISWPFLCDLRAAQACRRTTISTGMRLCLPIRVSSAWTISLPSSPGLAGSIGHFGHPAANEMRPFFQHFLVKLIVDFAGVRMSI